MNCPICYGLHLDDDRCDGCTIYDACLAEASRREPAAPGIPARHMPAIWRITGEARNEIMEATGLELAVEARIEDIRTSHRGREYVRR